MIKILSAVLLFAGAIAASVSGLAGEAPERPATIRGRIASIDGDELIVAAANGRVAVKLSDKTNIRIETALGLEDLKPGVYLGTTAQKQPDGMFRASEVHIFPETQRGTSEGHRPSSSTPGSTMTNASVDKVDDATVADVKGRVLTLKYSGGEVRVFVPPGIPIVRREPGTRAPLKAGAAVVVQGQRMEGSVAASQITIAAEGKPPI